MKIQLIVVLCKKLQGAPVYLIVTRENHKGDKNHDELVKTL
jgi:hypothetical protein